ncbi:putative polysaccharide biosynthesis protein [Ferdinandcohnia quinoae]|uniref:Polysaccharide biosynthesis protein n=1 Tax=Fredinandcohnia quinoae TaxID=2918902 RepID=A0AAW5E268_9BACI|nr:polysaccharide biosynthesis protein [Fredinandcohnia sp. SECRCQ15]MCH1625370.1 polysaccharide biosynthesis protein [Fredinandcohnia sp. SECRCQ15]
MSESKLLRGTFILTLGTYISRILGMIYIFPFTYLVGETGIALYQYGYGQYTIFLAISTAGLPMAVSKFVSKYNSLGDYHTGRRMLKSGLFVMTITGFLSFLLLYSLAPVLAPIQLGGDKSVYTADDVVSVIRMVSFALLIVPIMSMMRGFFQGHQSMGPTALSQVIEQIARVIFLLSSAYIVIELLDGGIKTAIGYATFAAFIGAIGGLGVMIWYWLKRKPYLDDLLATSKPQTEISTKQIYKELISYSAPFVFVGLAIPLYSLIDQYTFNRALNSIGEEEIQNLFGIVTGLVPKLVMIPVSIATAFSLTLVPTITKSFTDGDFSLLRKQIDKTFQICVLLVLPAVVGMAVLSYPMYNSFFGLNEAGGNVLRWYAPVAILFSFFSITAAILQGINKQKFAVVSLAIGLIVKLICNIPFLIWFGEIGSVLATALGYTVSIAYNFWMISRHAQYSFSFFVRRSLLMGIFAFVMAIGIVLIEWLLSFGLSVDESRGQSTVVLLIGVVVGAVIYLFLAYRSRLLEILLGSKFAFRKTSKKAVD